MSNKLDALNLLERIKKELNEPKKLELKLKYMYLKLEDPELNYIQEKMILNHEIIEKTPPVNKWFISFNKGICMWESLYDDSLYILILYSNDYNLWYSVENYGYNNDNGYDNDSVDIRYFEEYYIYPPINDDGKQLKIIPQINGFNSRDINFFAE